MANIRPVSFCLQKVEWPELPQDVGLYGVLPYRFDLWENADMKRLSDSLMSAPVSMTLSPKHSPLINSAIDRQPNPRHDLAAMNFVRSLWRALE